MIEDFPEEYLTTENTDLHGLNDPCSFRELRVIRGWFLLLTAYFRLPTSDFPTRSSPSAEYSSGHLD